MPHTRTRKPYDLLSTDAISMFHNKTSIKALKW